MRVREDLFQSLNSVLRQKVEHLTNEAEARARASLCRDGEILNSSLSTRLDLAGGEGTHRLLELPGVLVI